MDIHIPPDVATTLARRATPRDMCALAQTCHAFAAAAREVRSQRSEGRAAFRANAHVAAAQASRTVAVRVAAALVELGAACDLSSARLRRVGFSTTSHSPPGMPFKACKDRHLADMSWMSSFIVRDYGADACDDSDLHFAVLYSPDGDRLFEFSLGFSLSPGGRTIFVSNAARMRLRDVALLVQVQRRLGVGLRLKLR